MVQEKIVIICGPTAVGKTAAGVALAQSLGGEIVSADSQQVWRGFDVGTAKPSAEDVARVPHHLIDVAEPSERFDAARFVELADGAIAEIASRGRLPMIVGGTGMYIRMLVHGICDAPPRDEDVRAEIEAEIAERGTEALHARLAAVDPEGAASISQNDRTRIVRALEIFELTGEPASGLRQAHGFADARYDALKIGLDIPRDELYRRIDARCERMWAAGLVDEARRLLERFGDSAQPFSAVGYREALACLEGEMGEREALALMQRNTRRLAKRQLTWFRADQAIRWFAPDRLEPISDEIEAFN